MRTPDRPHRYGTGETLFALSQKSFEFCIKQRFRHVFTQKHELIPADTENVSAPKMLEKQLAQRTDVFVTFLVSKVIIDIFEIVEINESNAKTSGAFFSVRHASI